MQGLQNKIKILVLALHISQFVVLTFFFQGLVGILRENGIPLKYLGLIYLLGLFSIFRFLWAPLLDKVKFDKFGHYRCQIIIFELLMIISLLIMSQLSVNGFLVIITFCILFAFFAACQDIAIDALVYKVCLTDKQRNVASSLKTAGVFIGAFIGGGSVLFIYDNFGWKMIMLFLAIITMIPLIFMINFKEPNTEYKNPKSSFILVEFFNFWRGKKRIKWLILLLLCAMPMSMSYGIMSPMMVDTGISLSMIGVVFLVGNVAGATSSLLSGKLINKFGRKNIFTISSLLLAIAISLLYFLAGGNLSRKYHIFITGAIVFAILFSFSPILTCILSYILDEIQEKRLIGSQYAIQHGVYMVSDVCSASIGLMLAGVIGYKSVIMICIIVSFIVAYMGYNKQTT